VSPGLLLKAAILAKKNSKNQTSSLQLKQTYKNNPTTIKKTSKQKKNKQLKETKINTKTNS